MSEAEARQSWSIIVLCYNEAENIERVVRQVQAVLLQISKDQGQLVLVNDGSSDNSDEVIRQLLKQPENQNITYVSHKTNQGIGAALHSGYAHATQENVVMVPGDGQFDVTEFLPHKNIESKTILAFYRVENTTYTWSRNILSWFNNTLNRIFIGLDLRDVNWVKVYKNEALKSLDLEIKSSLVESEICSKLIYLGYRPKEIRSKYLPRQAGQSKGASFKIVRQALLDIVRLIGAFHRFKKKLREQM